MKTSTAVISVGYEGRTAAELVDLLVQSAVDVVVDVRLNPISRKPGLSKTKLTEHLRDAGIDYLHVRALGNPRENRAPFWSGRVAEGVDRFRGLMDEPAPSASLDEVAELARVQRVAVLCFERDHARCHRQVVTEALMSRLPDAAVAEV